MKEREFLNELRAQGVVITDGTKHYKLFYRGRMATMRRHPSQEVLNSVYQKIIKQLGLKK